MFLRKTTGFYTLALLPPTFERGLPDHSPTAKEIEVRLVVVLQDKVK